MTEKKVNSGKRDIINFIGIFAIILLANFILSFFFGRFDLTEDNRHSLSENTIQLLQDETRIKDRIFFKIYLDGDLPADFMKIRNAIQEKLDEFSVYAGDKIQYEFIDPNGEDDEDYNLEVQKKLYDEGNGIMPTDIEIIESGAKTSMIVWPGAKIEYKGSTVDQIQFFQKQFIGSNEDTRGLAEGTINNIEYQLISAIRRVTADDKKTVGFLGGHGELDFYQTGDVRAGLNRYYLIEDVEINGQIKALDDIDALVIAQPKKPFSEKDKFVIDQFVMNGGRVLWFVDPIDVNRDSLYFTGETYGISANLNIEKDMLFKYGARLNSNTILDQSCAPLAIPGLASGTAPWYFYPLLQRENHLITRSLDPIKAEYTSSVDPVNLEDKAVEKTVLLRSSLNAQEFKAPSRINYGIINIEPNFNQTQGKGEYPVALMLEGEFTSVFENRIDDSFLNSPDFKTKFKSEPNKMLVVADGDIIRNEVDSRVENGKRMFRPIPLKYDIFGVMNPNGTPKYRYGNKEFFLNCVDYMLADFSLIDIRAKSITIRGLNEEKVAQSKEMWKVINIAFPLICIILLATFQIVSRKRKYARTKA
ncbi:gliding motility-associated ABC transporter substrate-binding protein GldG [Crocinitomix algicola]|uniref:gliding motility-associated ABC transporter substrate-binding protein GldG n=1 Tax=Crocinitomix algicola TaxID=1740263 RepID=UPI0015865412|nr:gliding motility-associated ABC transporter substrate-binding protein GldG [Crocinitomix algicola]